MGYSTWHIYFTLYVFLASIVYVNTAFPNFSDDTYTEDVLETLDKENQTWISKVRKNNGHLPEECKRDKCTAETFETESKGTYVWQPVQVGMRQYIRCAYALDTRVYASRDCVLHPHNHTVIWSSHVNTTSCPEPPLAEVVRSLQQKTLPGSIWDQASLNAVYTVIEQYPDCPTTQQGTEVVFVYQVLSQVLENTPGDVTTTQLQCFLETADFLLQDRFLPYVDLHPQMHTLVPRLLSALVVVCSRQSTRALGRQGGYITRSGGLGLVSGQAEETAQWLYEDEALRVAVLPYVIPDKKGKLPRVNLFFTKTFLLSNIAQVKTPDSSTVSPLNGTDQGRSGDSPPAGPRMPSDGKARVRRQLPVLDLYGWTQRLVDMLIHVSLVQSSGSPPPSEISLDVPLVEYTYRHYHVEVRNQACTWNREAGKSTLTEWDAYGQSMYCEKVMSNVNMTSCKCRGWGYYGVSGRYILDSGGKSADGQVPGLAEFLGFPYSYELVILSHILRAVSLVCLILTITSYVIFRKVRRGRATQILLHLCCTLVALLVVLYLTDAVAAHPTGCVVASVFRFYLIMVSLMWNAVEAYNMYLMLVKVFDNGVSRMMVKAALIAWGVPALVVILVLAINNSSFDGKFIECKFRCILPEKTLYYAYLLPMCIIIIHNLIVFGLVTKIICTHHSSVNSASSCSGPSRWEQLAGALALLALLGVPWIFSAFGAIDAHSSDSLQATEIVFQVVFVIGVNLQGVFIFAFHCARNSELRQQWRSAVTSHLIPSGSTLSSSGQGNTNSTHLFQHQTKLSSSKT